MLAPWMPSKSSRTGPEVMRRECAYLDVEPHGGQMLAVSGLGSEGDNRSSRIRVQGGRAYVGGRQANMGEGLLFLWWTELSLLNLGPH